LDPGANQGWNTGKAIEFIFVKALFQIPLLLLFIATVACNNNNTTEIESVLGPVDADQLGKSLSHEHVLVDFIGADYTGYHRWDREAVAERILPNLIELKNKGYRSVFECTPAYLGRDPILLKILSERSGLNIITNTGYYGARNNKFLPSHALEETAEELADRWIGEWKYGIEDTGIRPGFIKISVENDSVLSAIHKKLIRAAAITHKATGLTIASHTGLSSPAFEQLKILEEEKVSPEAFIWVHAQAEKELEYHIKAAQSGAWISLDNVNDSNIDAYIPMLGNLKDQNLLDHVLISHDSGWYSPGEINGGEIRGYLDIEYFLIPKLKENGFTKEDIHTMLVVNPAKAYAISLRLIKT
jgi:phosphotriesterase-related protein